MGWLLRRCVNCRKYTLSTKICPYCGSKVRVPHPAKYSPNDKYAKHRIALKKEGEKRENFN